MALTDEEIIKEVYDKWGEKIERLGNEFIIVSDDLTPKHDKVRYINQFIVHLIKENKKPKAIDEDDH